MTEHVGTPFTAYNNTGNVATLVGNWQEEAVLKAVTGTSKNKVLLCHISKARAAPCAVFSLASSQLHPCTRDTNVVHYQQVNGSSVTVQAGQHIRQQI
jgi:hypothetical protein